MSRLDYAELFAVIGTLYGAGDRATTFNLPDMRGRVVVGKDAAQAEFDTLNEAGGEKTHTLTVNEMPAHTHADGGRASYTNYWMSGGTPQTGAITTDKQNTASAGGGQPHNNLQPYRVLNYIIKAKHTVPIDAVVEDSLASESTTNALSAKQGKMLNEKITSLFAEGNLAYGTGFGNPDVATIEPIRWTKIGNMVFLGGCFYRGTGENNILTTLPVGIRPSKRVIVGIRPIENYEEDCIITVNPDGTIACQFRDLVSPPFTHAFSLNGISYRIR